MTHSKTAAIRTAIAVIATLFLAGCMSGDHGVKRMAGPRAWRQRLPPTRRRVAGIEQTPRLPMAACPT